MKQKTVLYKGFLYKNGEEIRLSKIQELLLKTLRDNLVHSHVELIKNAYILRGVGEENTLRLHILRLITRTRLKIRCARGQGYYLDNKIYVVE